MSNNTAHTYEVSLDDVEREQEKKKSEARAEEGGISVGIPQADKGSLLASQDAVSPSFAQAIEQAVASSVQEQVAQQTAVTSKANDGDRASKLEKENEALQVSIQKLQDEKRVLEASVKELKGEVKERRTKEETEKIAHEEALISIESKYIVELRDLRNALEKAEEQVRASRSSGKTSERAEELERTVQVLQAENAKNKAQIESLMNEISVHGGRLRNQEQRLQAEISSKGEVTSALDVLRGQLRVKDAEITLAKQNAAETTSKLSQVNLVVTQLRSQNEQLQKQLTAEIAKNKTSPPSTQQTTTTTTATSQNPPSAFSKPINSRSPFSRWLPPVVVVGISAAAVARYYNKI